LQSTKIEKCRTGERIHQQIEIAAILIGATQHRAENTRIRGTKATRGFSNSDSFELNPCLTFCARYWLKLGDFDTVVEGQYQ